MKRLILLIIILFGFVFPVTISEDLENKINALSSDDTVTIQIYFKRGIDINSLTGLPRSEKIAILKNSAKKSQFAVYQQLIQKNAENIESFWAGNLIIARVKISDLKEICQDDKVIYLDVTRIYQIDPPIITEGESIGWNIQKIRAPEVWAEGYTGKEVVIGFIDTGVEADHPDIKAQRRGFDSWYDATTNGDSLNPYDDYGHGTHVIGTACGRNGIGVAPDAQWVMVRAFVHGSGSSADIHESFDWLAGLDEPPQIISNSWGSWSTTSLEFWPDLETMRSLGIIPVFANGNSEAMGPSTPGNFPLVIGVGATNKKDSLGCFSSVGLAPNQEPWTNQKYWPYPEWNRLKPDICAPGVEVKSCYLNGGYITWSGTSMACPHLAGAIALILEKNLTLNFKSVYWLLTQNAHHISYGGKIPNDHYGWGRLDVYEAFKKAPEYEIKENLICQNIPNPFIEHTVIAFQLKHPVKTTLKIYDRAGRLIKTFLEKQSLNKGYYRFNWFGENDSGQKVSSGIYFCLLRVGKTQQTIKIVYLKKRG